MSEDVKREELRLKMVEHQDIARKYRDQINKIDRAKEEAKRARIIGKCFKLNASEDPEKPSWHGYFRVERFDEGFRPIGTKIDIWTQFNRKNPYMTLEINHQAHEEWILNGKNVSHKVFNEMLARVKSNIILWKK